MIAIAHSGEFRYTSRNLVFGEGNDPLEFLWERCTATGVAALALHEGQVANPLLSRALSGVA